MGVPGNYGNFLLLSRKGPPLSVEPWGKVLGLQLSQVLNHRRDEGLVLLLLHGVDLGLRPIINCKRHKKWDGP